MPASGSESPIASNSASSAFASPRPANSPTSDAPRPITRASTSTEPSTWRRKPPTIRSSPSSRVRWATVIESVLKMVNAPTRMATPPKTSRAIRMIEMNCSSPSRVKRSWAWAVVTPASGTAAAIASREAEPATRIPSTWFPRSNSAMAVSMSKTAAVVTPIDFTEPKREMPTTSKSCARPRAVICTVEPTP